MSFPLIEPKAIIHSLTSLIEVKCSIKVLTCGLNHPKNDTITVYLEGDNREDIRSSIPTSFFGYKVIVQFIGGIQEINA